MFGEIKMWIKSVVWYDTSSAVCGRQWSFPRTGTIGNTDEPRGNWCLGPSTGGPLRESGGITHEKFWNCIRKIVQFGAVLAFLNTLTTGTAFPSKSPLFERVTKPFWNCFASVSFRCADSFSVVRGIRGRTAKRPTGPRELQPKLARIRVHNNLPTRHWI